MGGHNTEPEGCDFKGAMAFMAGLVMGTGSTVTIKIVYMMSSTGIDGEYIPFEKPLTTTWVMFLAMTFALPIFFIHQALFTKEIEKYYPSKGIILKLLIPSMFDLLGTALAKVGLLYCTVSVYQLVRCTVIIITAILKAFVLKEKLEKYMWTGVFINLLAMCLVSSTTFFQASNKEENNLTRDPRLGVLFIVLSCCVQGTQYVFEEKVMSVDRVPPLIVVGFEGLWGAITMLLVVFPLAYAIPGDDKGSVENVYDSWVMICNSTSIQIVLFAFFITVAGYNVFAIFVTHFLSSIWHAILDNFRPISVWSTDLLLFYVFTNGEFGESWNYYSWFQFAGMMLLFFGTAVYNGSIPGFNYASTYSSLDQDFEKGRERSGSKFDNITPMIRTPSRLASPALMRSPMISRGYNPIKQENSNSIQNNGYGYGAMGESHPYDAHPYGHDGFR